MTRYLLCTFLLISTLSFAQVREDRSGGSFNTISVGASSHVIITKGNTHKVVLEGDAEDLEEVLTEIEGNRLSIKLRNSGFFGGTANISRIKVFITMAELSEIDISGSGSVESADIFTTDEFEASISGSGKISLNIEAEETEVDISGSGKVILKGKTRKADLSISGSGDVEAVELITEEAEINIMGSGNCSIHVTEKLNSKVMGSGNLRYAGDPKHVNNDSMGSGKIRKI